MKKAEARVKKREGSPSYDLEKQSPTEKVWHA